MIEEEVDEEEEEGDGHLIDDEDCPGDSTSQELWHIHSQPGLSVE